MELEFSYYQRALSFWQAKDKALKEVMRKLLCGISCKEKHCSLEMRKKLVAFYDLLEKPADFFITESEWRNLK